MRDPYLYEWAGEPHIIAIYKEEDVLDGMSVEYSDPFDITRDIHFILSDMRGKPWKDMDRKEAAKLFSGSLAQLWKVHPFRDYIKRMGQVNIIIKISALYKLKKGRYFLFQKQLNK